MGVYTGRKGVSVDNIMTWIKNKNKNDILVEPERAWNVSVGWGRWEGKQTIY